MEKKEKKKKKELEHYTLKLRAPLLDFDRFPLSIYSQSNKNWLVNLKLKDQGQDKASIRKILTWGFFVKTSLFDSLFLVNLMFLLQIFYVFWKGTMYGFL